MTTILITGFGPFPGAPFNPTGALVVALARLRDPALRNVRRVAHVFATSYAAVDRELPALLARERPDVLLMFGLAARTPCLRIETRARNAVSLLAPDAGGRVLPARGIRAGAPAALSGRAPFRKLLRAARAARVPARLSRDAGSYLCNYAYWRGSEATSGNRIIPVVAFVHVPRVRCGSGVLAAKRTLTLTDLARAGEAIMRAALATMPTRRPMRH